MKQTIFVMIAAVFWCFAQTAVAEFVEEATGDFPDNTGALSTTNTDNTANIAGEGEEVIAMGTVQGEITLYKTSSGIEVYSGYNKVEVIPNNSEGWVGKFPLIESSMIKFQPAGRPVLQCPLQDVANWYGPCKMETQE